MSFRWHSSPASAHAMAAGTESMIEQKPHLSSVPSVDSARSTTARAASGSGAAVIIVPKIRWSRWSAVIDRERGVDAVRLAQQEVVLAMVGGHVDEAGTGVGGDEVAGQEGARLGEEAAEMVHRVAGKRAFQILRLNEH